MSKDEANPRSEDEEGCLSKLQVFLRSELLVVAALKVIRDEDVREQKEEEI
jgi:hypothetical protein